MKLLISPSTKSAIEQSFVFLQKVKECFLFISIEMISIFANLSKIGFLRGSKRRWPSLGHLFRVTL